MGGEEGVGYSHTPLSVVQPFPSQDAIPLQEELPPPQLPLEKKGECFPVRPLPPHLADISLTLAPLCPR